MGYKKELKTCEQCGKEYFGTKTRKYCSYDCSHESRKRRKTLICEECGIEFEVQDYRDAKFCSQECKIKHQSSKIISVKCDNCNQNFVRKEYKIGTFNFCCKQCSDEFHKGENHYEWKEYLHIEGIRDALRKWSKAVKTRDDYICKECGKDERSILHAHHIKHKEHFPELMFDEQNGITLCVYCHINKHRDNKKSEQLLQYIINKYEEELYSRI